MKKQELIAQLITLSIAALLCVLCFLAISCGTRKNTESIKNTELARTQISHVQTHQAISDRIFIPVPTVRTTQPECDSVCQIAVKEALMNIQTSKTSGTNSYGFKFDKEQNGIVGFAEIGATENSQFLYDHYFTKNESKTIEIPVKYIPKWVQILALIGGGFLIYFFIKIGFILRKKASLLT